MNDESLAGSGGDTRPLPLPRPLLGLPSLPRAYQVNLQVSLPSLSIAFKCLGLPSLPVHADDAAHVKFSWRQLVFRLFTAHLVMFRNDQISCHASSKGQHKFPKQDQV